MLVMPCADNSMTDSMIGPGQHDCWRLHCLHNGRQYLWFAVVLRYLHLLKGEAAFDPLCENWDMMVKY